MERQNLRDKAAAAASGGLAGAVVSILVQPLDVIRTRMQGDGAKGSIRGPMSTFHKIYKESGPTGFWRGTGPTVLRMSIGAALHFVCIEAAKNILASTKLKQNSESLHNALVGGLSRGAVTIMLCPITVIKTRMEYVDRSYNSTIHAGLTIVKHDGVRGLFKGVVPTFVANAPFSALHYMFYRKLQGFMYGGDTNEQSFGKNFVCSTIAAATATVLTQPADVVRTRIQLGYGATGTFAAVATLKDVFVGQGLRGVTLGVAPRMFKRTLQTGLIWTVYEELFPVMQRLMNSDQTPITTS